MKRCGFVVDGEVAIDELWLFVKQLSDLLQILLFNVPEEVFIGGIAMSDALDRSHFYTFLSIFYNLNGFYVIPKKNW